MGALQNILLSALVLAIAFSFQAYRDLTKPHPKPELDFGEYWGRGDAKRIRRLNPSKFLILLR